MDHKLFYLEVKEVPEWGTSRTIQEEYIIASDRDKVEEYLADNGIKLGKKWFSLDRVEIITTLTETKAIFL